MYDCKTCHGEGFIRVPERNPAPLVVTFEPVPEKASHGFVMAPCPNCGGLRQRMEYGGGSYRIRAYEHEHRIAEDKESFERHALQTAARGAFEAMVRHGAFKLERHDPPDLKENPMAEVEYRARIAIIMPAAHNYFDEQLEAARQEGRAAVKAEVRAQAEVYRKLNGPGSVIMDGLIRDIEDNERRAARMRDASSQTPSD